MEDAECCQIRIQPRSAPDITPSRSAGYIEFCLVTPGFSGRHAGQPSTWDAGHGAVAVFRKRLRTPGSTVTACPSRTTVAPREPNRRRAIRRSAAGHAGWPGHPAHIRPRPRGTVQHARHDGGPVRRAGGRSLRGLRRRRARGSVPGRLARTPGGVRRPGGARGARQHRRTRRRRGGPGRDRPGGAGRGIRPRRTVRRGFRRSALRCAGRRYRCHAGGVGGERLAGGGGGGRGGAVEPGPGADVGAGRHRRAQPPLRRNHPLVWSPIMKRVVCPGSFDPVTNGHLDIISRSARLYDEVVVAVLVNQSKAGLFTLEERISMLREVTAHYPNVRVQSFQGLLVDFCKANDIDMVIKGIRAASDFDYELQMAQMNVGLAGVETLFMATNPLYSFVSSSLIKDVAKWGGDVTQHVPELVAARLHERLAAPPS